MTADTALNEANAAVQKLAAKLRIVEALYPDRESRGAIADAIWQLKGLSICLQDVGPPEAFLEDETDVRPVILNGLVDF